MSSESVVPENAKDEFWAVVVDCLREIHGMKQEACRRKAGKHRIAIEQMTESQVDFFYHSEPFDVACELANALLKVEEYLDQYLQIRDEKHGNGISHQRRRPNA